MGTYDKATGTIPTHWVYVKVTGLYVGNYRMMLSIGSAPTDSYNKVGEHKFYANSNIENPTEIAQRVFLGEETELKLGEEILEIDESNYGDYFGEAGQPVSGPSGADQGRHVPLRGGRFEPLSVLDVHRPASRGVEVLVQVGGQ